MKLNFKEFSIPSGISKRNWQTTDVREQVADLLYTCLLYTSPSPRDISGSRMPSSA